MTIEELEEKWKSDYHSSVSLSVSSCCDGCMFCMKCIDEDGEPNHEQVKCFRWFLEHKATREEQAIAENAGFRFEREPNDERGQDPADVGLGIVR